MLECVESSLFHLMNVDYQHLFPDQRSVVEISYVVVLSLSRVQLFVITRTAADQAYLSFTICWNLIKFMSIKSMLSSNLLILYRPLLFLPSIFPSIRVFSSESVLRISWPKYWSVIGIFSLSLMRVKLFMAEYFQQLTELLIRISYKVYCKLSECQNTE